MMNDFVFRLLPKERCRTERGGSTQSSRTGDIIFNSNFRLATTSSIVYESSYLQTGMYIFNKSQRTGAADTGPKMNKDDNAIDYPVDALEQYVFSSLELGRYTLLLLSVVG